jgi:Domain of unknown function (DUF4268)
MVFINLFKRLENLSKNIMYKINRLQNNIIKLEERLFSDLKIKERENLQEWIAKNPDILGEELLIIQKEYDGFNDTNERLDLLALDKEGSLVIIENKLDDTGRNVVWQALKYTSYCSTLTTIQIVKMYQDYLVSIGSEEKAVESIVEFLEWEEDDLLLNRNDQRIIFVANHYRKEVTSTVLWLINHDIKIQCFRATPYSMDEELFLQIEQIIPLPETEEFMIDAKEKEKEDKVKSKVVAETEATLIKFWSILKKDLQEHQFPLLDNVTPRGIFSIGSFKGRGKFAFCIGRKGMRVELYFRDDPDKRLFDGMYEYKDEINSKFSDIIEWERLDNKKASRIKFEKPSSEITPNPDDWNEKRYDYYIKWFRESMVEFYKVIYPIWFKVDKNLN